MTSSVWIGYGFPSEFLILEEILQRWGEENWGYGLKMMLKTKDNCWPGRETGAALMSSTEWCQEATQMRNLKEKWIKKHLTLTNSGILLTESSLRERWLWLSVILGKKPSQPRDLTCSSAQPLDMWHDVVIYEIQAWQPCKQITPLPQTFPKLTKF